MAVRSQASREDAWSSTRLSLKAVARLSGISRPALQLRVSHGELPPPMGVRPRDAPGFDPSTEHGVDDPLTSSARSGGSGCCSWPLLVP